jgi:hypothetical protein
VEDELNMNMDQWGGERGDTLSVKLKVLGEKMNLVLVMTIPFPHTHNYMFIILTDGNMFQLEDSHQASTKNSLQVTDNNTDTKYSDCP